MNWFIGFLLTVSLFCNAIMALVIADMRADRKLPQPSNDDLDAELLRIVNGGKRDG